ncbi:MAG: 3-isopropylmalate dehydratase large subunit, partial [Betaproteobacteria bacterium]|nr:3-isopropylmalate dehydratase large subunit [Betaproteobacteria bacterium]
MTIRRPNLSLATPDHFNSTASASLIAIQDPHKRSLVERLRDNAKREAIVHFAIGEIEQGIAHVVGPEQGFTLPG